MSLQNVGSGTSTIFNLTEASEESRWRVPDPVTEKYLQLKEMLEEYRETSIVDRERVEALLANPQAAKLPANYPHRVISSNDIWDSLRTSVATIVKHVGFEDFDQEATEALAEIVDQKLRLMSRQFKLSQERRAKSRPVAFKSALQHTLCLNGVQHIFDLKNFYNSRIRKKYEDITRKWRRILDNGASNTEGASESVAADESFVEGIAMSSENIGLSESVGGDADTSVDLKTAIGEEQNDVNEEVKEPPVKKRKC